MKGRSDDAMTGVIAFLVMALVVVSGVFLWGTHVARRDSPSAKAADQRIRQEQHADDVSWVVLKDVARRHLAAVRSDATKLPDEELGDALMDYSGNGKRDERTPRSDPTDRLAALKKAAADLDRPDRPIRCHEAIRSNEDPACGRYLDALVAVFGRDL